MGFTTSCFIRKNTEELRSKLEDLGYAANFSTKDHDIIYTDAEHGVYFTTFASNITDDEVAYDCKYNRTLFLAIAALRDDTDKNQWFTDGYHWEKCPDEVAYINAWIYKYECSPHKATVDELFEHFYQYKQ